MVLFLGREVICRQGKVLLQTPEMTRSIEKIRGRQFHPKGWGWRSNDARQLSAKSDVVVEMASEGYELHEI